MHIESMAQNKHTKEQHYDIDKPLCMQFDELYASTIGGLDSGGCRRLQPSIGSLTMDVTKSYLMTPKSLRDAVEWLNKEINAGKKNDPIFQRLAREFVDKISKVE